MKRLTAGVVGVSMVLMMGGCNTDLDSLNPFTNKELNEVKKEATLAKETLEMSKECLNLAKSTKEANECNQKAKEHYPKLKLDNFKRWNKKVKKKTMSIIDEKLKESECVLKAPDMDSAKKCVGAEDSNKTTMKK